MRQPVIPLFLLGIERVFLVSFEVIGYIAIMVKIYTKRGDKGETSLYGGHSVVKSNPRVEACGTVDELNSFLGACVALLEKSLPNEKENIDWLHGVQEDLFTLGSWLASPKASQNIVDGKEPWTGGEAKELKISEGSITRMEEKIDSWSAELEPLKYFILPGGSLLGAQMHIARAVCRRTERLCVQLKEQEILVPEIVFKYMNRLSDALFVLARFLNKKANKKETPWKG